MCVSICVCVYICVLYMCMCLFECVCVCTCWEPWNHPLKSRHCAVQLETDWLQSVHNSGLSVALPSGQNGDGHALASGAVHTQWLIHVCVQRLGLFVSIQNNYKELAQLQRFLWYICFKLIYAFNTILIEVVLLRPSNLLDTDLQLRLCFQKPED